MFLQKEHVEEHVVTSDYSLLQVLVAHAQEKLNQFSSGVGFYETLKKSVVNLIKPEFPTIDQVAGT